MTPSTPKKSAEALSIDFGCGGKYCHGDYVCEMCEPIIKRMKSYAQSQAAPLLEAVIRLLKFEASCGENDIPDEDRKFAKQAIATFTKENQ